MEKHAWRGRTKDELAIEVWEALDCESIGRAELEAISVVVRDVFGAGAVESPARLARLLADEGAELRHMEILAYDVERRTDDPYQAMFRNVFKFGDLNQAATTVRNLDNLRRKFATEKDREGQRRLQALALRMKKRAQATAKSERIAPARRAEGAEIAEWLTVWLNQPEIFDTWLDLRRRSDSYREKFGAMEPA